MENDSMFGFHCTEYGEKNTAHWLSWLERRPVTAEVDGSSPSWVVYLARWSSGQDIALSRR